MKKAISNIGVPGIKRYARQIVYYVLLQSDQRRKSTVSPQPPSPRDFAMGSCQIWYGGKTRYGG
ncbi:MAG: hypothetical protein PHE53_06360 [Thermoguttaceae bacterium]|nr:hypothetical protein [Thermoguttaceae bacterium]